MGWATAPDGAAVYADQQTIALTADTTLYAVWREKHVSLLYRSTDESMGTVSRASEALRAISDTAAAGSTAQPNSGYLFVGWFDDQDNQLSDSSTYVPQQTGGLWQEAIYYARFARIQNSGSGATSYPITVLDSTPDGGAVSVSASTAPSGSTVTVTVDPDDGYELYELTVTANNGRKIPVTARGGGRYTFEMPASGVTIAAAFQASVWNRGYGDCLQNHTCPIWPFSDADARAWYHDGVHFCLENSLMLG